MRTSILVFLLIGAFAAVAEPPVPIDPIVHSIDYAVVPVEGGTIIAIRGLNFDGGPCQVHPHDGCGPAVSFSLPHPDGCCFTGAGEIVSASDTELFVKTPPHIATLADVHVLARSGRRTTVRGGLRFGRPGFRRVLLPVGFRGEVPGAFGSRWVTELTGRIFYRGQAEVTRTPYSEPRHLVEGPFRFDDLPTHGHGAFVYVPEGDFLDLSLRVRDVSRENENYGTEVPLVTSEETTTAFGFFFLDIPMGPKYRQTLRVYNFEGKRAANIGVRILARNGTENLVFNQYTMPDGPIEEFPTEPGYLELNLADLLPGYEGSVDVSVSHSAGPRLWSMVSITNNETQMVTMVTPTMSENGSIAIIQ